MDAWICGANVRYEFCDNSPDDDCYNGHGVSGAGAAYSASTGHGDKLTTLKLYAYDAVNGTGAATVYYDSDCTSDSAYFMAGDLGVSVGYTYDDIKYWNFHQDELSAVRVPVGYTLTIYKDNGF
jgi:hypothetical protein